MKRLTWCGLATHEDAVKSSGEPRRSVVIGKRLSAVVYWLEPSPSSHINNLIHLPLQIVPYSIKALLPEPIPVFRQSARTVTVIKPAESCHYFPSGPRLPSQLQSITTRWPVPNYTAWWHKTTCPELLHESGTVGSRTGGHRYDVWTTTLAPSCDTTACSSQCQPHTTAYTFNTYTVITLVRIRCLDVHLVSCDRECS